MGGTKMLVEMMMIICGYSDDNGDSRCGDYDRNSDDQW